MQHMEINYRKPLLLALTKSLQLKTTITTAISVADSTHIVIPATTRRRRRLDVLTGHSASRRRTLPSADPARNGAIIVMSAR